MQLEVPRSQFPEGIEPEEGEMLGVQVAPGQQAIARIARVNDDTVTLDLNHPLAGQTLVFDIELVGLK
jgi:peptidylprolyl isomerase